MVGIWLFFLVEWIIFTIFNIIYNNNDEYQKLEKFNFIQSVISNLCMITATMMFALAYKRVRNLD